MSLQPFRLSLNGYLLIEPAQGHYNHFACGLSVICLLNQRNDIATNLLVTDRSFAYRTSTLTLQPFHLWMVSHLFTEPEHWHCNHFACHWSYICLLNQSNGIATISFVTNRSFVYRTRTMTLQPYPLSLVDHLFTEPAQWHYNHFVCHRSVICLSNPRNDIANTSRVTHLSVIVFWTGAITLQPLRFSLVGHLSTEPVQWHYAHFACLLHECNDIAITSLVTVYRTSAMILQPLPLSPSTKPS